ncbi:hypothetical protein D1872_272760 [compost metagenome]
MFQGYTKLPVSCNYAAILVAVGITEHNFLQVIHSSYRLAVDWHAEQLSHNAWSCMKVIYCLKERYCLKSTCYSSICFFMKQTYLFCKHHYFKNITCSFCHTNQITSNTFCSKFFLSIKYSTVDIETFCCAGTVFLIRRS